MSRRASSMSMLTELMSDAIRSDYPHAPGPNGPERPSRRVGWTGPALLVGLVAALVLTSAALATRSAEPTLGAERTGLLDSIARAQVDLAATETTLVITSARVADLEAIILGGTATGRDLAERTERAAAAAGYEPLSGPGVTVSLSDSPDGERLGRVMDRDIQVVVNGLWQAGAEGVAVNGLRLTARTAIRTAGEAILVDYRPLAPPYLVEAVGDDLPGRFEATGTADLLDDLTATYGVGWEFAASDDIELPAARSTLPALPSPVGEVTR